MVETLRPGALAYANQLVAEAETEAAAAETNANASEEPLESDPSAAVASPTTESD